VCEEVHLAVPGQQLGGCHLVQGSHCEGAIVVFKESISLCQAGSFGRTANRGRWGTEQAMKQYVTTALAELAENQHQESDNSTLSRWASQLHAI